MEEKQPMFMVMAVFVLNGHLLQGNCETCKRLKQSVLTIDSDGNSRCVWCKLRPLRLKDGVISARAASWFMANISSLVESLNDSTTANFSTGEVKGAITKLPQNHTNVDDEKKSIMSNLFDGNKIWYRNVNKSGAAVSCNSWNGHGNLPTWTPEGCLTHTHLTFFAVLISKESKLPIQISLAYIPMVGCAVSIRSAATKVLTHLLVSVFCLNLAFLVNGPVASARRENLCVAAGAALHYALLASCSWFLVEILYLYFLLTRAPAAREYMTKICVAGWAIPALVVIAIVASGDYNLLTMTTEGMTPLSCGFAITRLLAMVGLLSLLAITWAFALFHHGHFAITYDYIFTILNSFHGLFLFIYCYNVSKTVEVDRLLGGRGPTNSNPSITAEINVYAEI
ncbi:hypothetical protein NHX12_020023 [Muraenolepis orangiensis]|uniref:G-protein coupled receptors family 2 profile 2 domain-containing protein n=1 Tax=Muraenolepis orangiensis TaxID=630683 RepID=A0A9Q0EUI5_9TELE|nr:hypothetical protein NHX12_020023 [Muraenolepis orangiensis]